MPGYAIYEAANRRLGPDDRLYLINMRSYGYYLRPDWRGDFVFELFQLDQALTSSATSSGLATFFASRGITHVLIDEDLTYADGVLRASQRAALQEFLSGRATCLDRVDRRALYGLHQAARPQIR